MSFFQKLKNKMPSLGRFTAIPAAMMDEIYLQEEPNWRTRLWNTIKLRFIYTAFFLPLAVVDLAVSFLATIRYAFGSFFLTDNLQDQRLAQQKKFSTIFSKNLYAILACAVGFIFPKLVVFFFTPEKSTKKGVSSGGGYYTEEKAELVQPKDVEEVQSVIAKAAAEKRSVMPVGAGRSQGKQFLPQGEKPVVIDLANLNTIEVNAKEKTVRVGAGARWSDIQMMIDKHKLALKVMQASNVFSVGGSVGTNIHGWDHQTGMLSNSIESIDIVNAKGELQTLTSKDPLFDAIPGSFGLLGTVVSVTFKLTDNVLLKEHGKAVSLEDYVKYFKENVATNEDIKMHLYRLSLDPKQLLAEGVAVNYVKEKGSAPVVTANLSQEGASGTRYDEVMINMARRSGFVRKVYWNGEKKRLLKNNSAPQTTNDIMRPPINAMFNPSVSESEWLQEYFLPGDQLAAFVKELGKLLMDNQVVLLNSSVRFVKQNDKSSLSYAKGGDRFAVVLCFNQSLQESEIVKAKKWLREAQHLAVKKGGSYYLPYQHVSSPEDFNQSYPHAQKLRELKQQVDPNGVFTSGFHQKYMAATDNKPNYFKEIMKSEETKRQFAGFLEKVLQRVDTKPFYALLEDILKYNDTHEEIYTELCRRLPEIMPSAIGSLRRILDSLSMIKKDLLAQAQTYLADKKTINGIVEIGYPGRFIGGFKKAFKVTGKIVAVNEAELVSDYVQTGFPRPYDQFVKLDYSQPSLAKLPANSADVMTCYVGLHHFPEDKLDAFLADVARVLRPGGRFLLVDHDIDNDTTMAMAHMAHMIFNAVAGTSVKEEMTELRNFKPMSHWSALLAKHGLGYSVAGPDVAMIRADDPSRNRMAGFVNKKPGLTLQADKPKEPVKEKVLADWKQPKPASVTHVSLLKDKPQTAATAQPAPAANVAAKP